MLALLNSGLLLLSSYSRTIIRFPWKSLLLQGKRKDGWIMTPDFLLTHETPLVGRLTFKLKCQSLLGELVPPLPESHARRCVVCKLPSNQNGHTANSVCILYCYSHVGSAPNPLKVQ